MTSLPTTYPMRHIPSWSLTTTIWFSAQHQLSLALLSAMPETVEQLNAYLAAKYSRPRDEDIAPRASSSSSHGIPAEHSSAPVWDEATQAFYARASAEPSLPDALSSFAPTPSPG